MQRQLAILLAVAVGGSVGAVLRALLADALGGGGAAWPWGTLVANVAGSALLGYVVARHPPDALGRHLLGPGLCGALTTFSTLQVELVRMLEDGRVAQAIGYLATTVALGLGAALAGLALGRRLRAAEAA